MASIRPADWITTTEAAEILGMSSRGVRQAVDYQHLTAKKVGARLILVTRKSVLAFKATRKIRKRRA